MSTSKTIANSITTNNDTTHQHKIATQRKHNRMIRKQRSTRQQASKVAVSALFCAAISLPPTSHGFSTARIRHSPVHVHQHRHTPTHQSKPNLTDVSRSYKSHDNNDEQQCQHEEATSNFTNRFSSRRSSDQQLKKQHLQQQSASSASSSPPQHQVSNVIHTIWTSSKSRRAKKQAAEYEKSKREQLILDNYLESIDKRYKRLHKRQGRTTKSSTNNAWQWLMKGAAAGTRTTSKNREEVYATMEEQRKMEDGIYVLGLAELASKQLLQRHHLPIPQSRKYDDSSKVIDIEGMSLSTTTTTTTMTKPMTMKNQKQQQGNLKKKRNMDKGKQLSETIVASSTDVSMSKFDLARSRSPLSIMLSLFHLLKGLQAAYIARLDVLSTRAMDTLKIVFRATGASIAKTANFLTMNGGGAKHTFHLATFLAMFVVTTASYAPRPITKA